MAEVAPMQVPSKDTLGEKFDEVFGTDDSLWTGEAEQAAPVEEEVSAEPVETQPEADQAEVVEEAEETQSEAELAAEEATEAVVNAPKPKGKDAQTRIRQLAAEKNQLRDELQRTQQYFNHQLEQMKSQTLAEQRAWREQQQEAVAMQREQFNLLRADREAAEFEKLPIDKKIEMRAQRESESRFNKALEERDRKWQARLDRMEAEKQAERGEVERQKRLGGLDQQAEQALDGVVLKGLAPEHAKNLRAPMKEMLMAWCGAYGEYPSEAAPRFAKYIDNMFAARLQTKRNPNVAKKVAVAGRAVPGAEPSGVKRLPAKRSIADSLKQRGLRGPLEDLADEIFGRD